MPAPMESNDKKAPTAQDKYCFGDDYYQMTSNFLCGLDLREGCFPVERWADIVQAPSDFSGYTVVLRAHVLEPAPSEDGLQLAGYKDVLTASPNVFLI
jgi:hypothetical protein